MRRRLVVLAFLAAAVPAGAQTPGGEIVETKDGIVFKKATPVPRPTPDRSLFRPTDAPGAPMVVPPPSKGPTGPAVVDASYLTVRGTLVKIEKGKAITVVDARTGRERRVLLTESTLVAEGLKAGDAVAVRVPFGDGTGARTAERVDLQKAPVEPPKGGLVKGQASPSP
jgi:hypothetical protein